MKKHLSILGATGSIGTQTIDILSSIDAEVVALTTNRNIKLLEQQARALHPKLCVAFDETAAHDLKIALADTDITVMSGMDGLVAAATHPDCDTVVTAVVGMVGLLPTLAPSMPARTLRLPTRRRWSARADWSWRRHAKKACTSCR